MRNILQFLVFCLLLNGCTTGSLRLLNNVRTGNRSAIKNCLNNSSCNESINASDKSGNTALHIASSHCDTSIASLLIGAGADYNRQNNAQLTPLLISFKNRADCPDMYKLFIAKGASINSRFSDGHTLIMESINNADSQTINLLLSENADITLTDSSGRTALMYACFHQDSTTAIKIIELDPAQKLARTTAGNMALHYAAFSGSVPCIRLLLANGSDPNEKNASNETPLFAACYKKREAAISFLLSSGAAATTRNSIGKYAFEGIFEPYKSAELSVVQNRILQQFFDNHFIPTDTITEPSTAAKTFFAAAEYFSLKGDSISSGKFYRKAKKIFLDEATVAITLADSIQNVVNQREAANLIASISLNIIIGTASGALSGALNSISPSYTNTVIYWAPVSGDPQQDIYSQINYIRNYASSCKLMASRCR